MRFAVGRRNISPNCKRTELVRESSSNPHPPLRRRRKTSVSAGDSSSVSFPTMSRVFLLSPAYAGGQRARMIMSERAEFELARRLRSENRPTLGEVFTFLSGLYFRGKLA